MPHNGVDLVAQRAAEQRGQVEVAVDRGQPDPIDSIGEACSTTDSSRLY